MINIRTIAINPDKPEQFIEIYPEKPTPGEYDLLVEVKAASVNPVETKVLKGYRKMAYNSHVFLAGMPVL